MKIEVDIKIPEAERKAIINSMIFLIDSREKENAHVIDYLDQMGINWQSKTFTVGDYSFKIPKNQYFEHDIYFDKRIVVERKAHLEELSNNFANGRTRFENELAEAYDAKTKLFLLIENANLTGILNGDYNTEYNKNAFKGTYFSFMDRYNFIPLFTPKIHTGALIHNIFKYHFSNLIK